MKKTYIKILKILQKRIKNKLNNLSPAPEIKNNNIETHLEFIKDKSTFKITTDSIFDNESGIKDVEANVNVKINYLDNSCKTIKIKGKVNNINFSVPLVKEDLYNLGKEN